MLNHGKFLKLLAKVLRSKDATYMTDELGDRVFSLRLVQWTMGDSGWTGRTLAEIRFDSNDRVTVKLHSKPYDDKVYESSGVADGPSALDQTLDWVKVQMDGWCSGV